MAHDPEHPGGQAVNGPDWLLIGAPLLLGSFLVAGSADKALRSGVPRKIAGRLARLHRAAHDASIDKGIIGFPGVRLVSSMRGWYAGEAVFLCAACLALTLDASAGSLAATIPAAFLLGGAAAFLSIREQARREIDGIRKALPVASFLLSLLLEAGMGTHAAVREVARAIPEGPLARELDEIARSRTIGVPRDEALERSRRRVPLDDYRVFLNLIQQGERLGTGLSQALRDHSSKMLEGQAHRAETLAQRAAVKLLFPLVVFIFPAVFLVILSPVILNLWDMMGG